MIEERRTHQRVKKHLTLKIVDRVFDVITETVDISPAGAYCRVTRLLPLMSKIEIVVLVPIKGARKETRKIRCKGAVVRSEPVILKDTERAHYNVAVFFTDISDRDRRIIENYVDSGNEEHERVEITN